MSSADKVVDLATLSRRVAAARVAGRSVALANGLFDVLHVGHLRYLEGAAREASLLVVALNSDASARRLKGPSRPIVPQHERAELVAGLACVDYVTVFDEDGAEAMLERLRPDVHCKGTDYTVDNVPEAPVARALGIRIAIVGDAKAHATRDLIRRIRGGS
ncbi:MAG TPA: adenylyltransferase/cytidyltransferase family protein [Candidatus Polarisedimenticolaceae bacterium]|nr:adenylyltransferase/cytidyltransferase family protein [Candidatus Polarisedimenticolaceae bacterium]